MCGAAVLPPSIKQGVLPALPVLPSRQQLRTPEALARMRCWQDDTPLAHLVFPYSYVLGLLPVAVLAAAGGGLSWLFAALLLLFTLCNDMWITWGHLKNLLLHG